MTLVHKRIAELPKGGSTITVDSELSDTSENPVQNKKVKQALGEKQPTLKSGQNIKTINGQSVLGGGNIQIEGGGGNSYTKEESDAKYQPKGNYQPAGNYATKTELNGKVDNVPGKGLSTNDYTTNEKTKLNRLPTESELIDQLDSKAEKNYVNTALSEKASLEDFQTLNTQIENRLDNQDQDIDDLQQLYENLQSSSPEPVTALPAQGEAGKIYRLAGSTSYADYIYHKDDLTNPIKMAEYDNAVDDEIDETSENLVKNKAIAETYGTYIEDDEFANFITDNEGKVVEGNKKDGTKFIGGDLEIAGKIIGKNAKAFDYVTESEDSEWAQVTNDSENKVLEGIRNEGGKAEKVFNIPVIFENQKYVDDKELSEEVVDAEGNVIEQQTPEEKVIKSFGFDYSSGRYQHIENKLSFGIAARKKFQEDNCLALGDWVVPNYYNAYLEKKTYELRKIIKNTIINGDAFYFVTDTHWEFNQQHSPAIIKHINNKLSIPRLFHGGDVYSEGLRLDKYGVDCINEFRHAIDNSNRVYVVDGNHEYISQTEDYGDTFAQFRIYLEDANFGGANKNYYYVDNKEKKIRYIVLLSFGKYTNGVIEYGFEDAEQINWFRDVALNVESGWDILVFCHYITSYSPYYNSLMTIAGAENIYNVVDNYQGNGNILAFITGHTHYDCILMDSCNYPIVCTTCDHNRSFAYTIDDGHGRTKGINDLSDLIEPRITDTITEHAFDVVVYDKDNHLLHLCRIGSRAMNRSTTFVGNAQVDYRTILLDNMNVGSTKVLSTLIEGNIMWNSANTNIISVSDGTITANSVGNTVITAVSDNGEMQSYFIKVI